MASMRRRCTGSVVSSASRKTARPSSGRRTHGVDLFGPRVRLACSVDTTIQILPLCSDIRTDSLTGLGTRVLDALVQRLRPAYARRGRPWALPLERRVVIACTSLRTNLTLRELAAVFGISSTQAHRIVTDVVRRLAALLITSRDLDRRYEWIVDGTLVPTRDHRVAAKAKNYRWSCNAQVLIRRKDLRVIAVVAGGPGNRNDPVHYRGSDIERLCRSHRRVLADGGYRGVPELITPVFRGRCMVRDGAWRRHRRRRARVEHAIARLEDWRVLRDHRRRGSRVSESLHAVAVLHNLKLELRNSS